MKRRIRIFLKPLVSVCLLAYVFSKVDMKELGTFLDDVDLRWFGLALACTLLSQITAAVRWVVLLKARDTHLSIARAVQLLLASTFFNMFLPSTIGGDAMRANQLSRLKGKRSDCYTSVVVERAVGLVALALIASCACVIGYRLIQDTYAGVAVALLWVAIAVGILGLCTWDKLLASVRGIVKPKPGGWAAKVLESCEAIRSSLAGFRGSHRYLAATLLISLVSHLFATSSAWPLALSIGINIHIGYFYVFSPLRKCIMMLPISVHGIGVNEATAVLFYTAAGMTEVQALAYALASYVLRLAMSTIGGVVYALSGTSMASGVQVEQAVPRG